MNPFRLVLALACLWLWPRPAWPQRLRLPLLPRTALPASAPLPALPAPTIPPPTALPALPARPEALLRDPLVLGAADAGAPEAAQAAGQLFDGGAAAAAADIPVEPATDASALVTWRRLETDVLNVLGLEPASGRSGDWRQRSAQILRQDPDIPLERAMARALTDIRGLAAGRAAEAEEYLATGRLLRHRLTSKRFSRLIQTARGVHAITDEGLYFLGDSGWTKIIEGDIPDPWGTVVLADSLLLHVHHGQSSASRWDTYEVEGASVRPALRGFPPGTTYAMRKLSDGVFIESLLGGVLRDFSGQYAVVDNRVDRRSRFDFKPPKDPGLPPDVIVWDMARFKGKHFLAADSGLYVKSPSGSVIRLLGRRGWRLAASQGRRVTQLIPHADRLFARQGLANATLGALHEYDGSSLKPVVGLPSWDQTLSVERIGEALLAWVGDDLFELGADGWRRVIEGDIARFDDRSWGTAQDGELFVPGRKFLHVRGPQGWRQLPEVGSIKGIVDLTGRRFAATSKGLYEIEGDRWVLLRADGDLVGLASRGGRLLIATRSGAEAFVIEDASPPGWRNALAQDLAGLVDVSIRSAGSAGAALDAPAADGTITDADGLPLFNGLSAPKNRRSR